MWGSPVNTNTVIIALPDISQLPAPISCISLILYLDPDLDLEILPESAGSTWCLFLDAGLFGKLMVGQPPSDFSGSLRRSWVRGGG